MGTTKSIAPKGGLGRVKWPATQHPCSQCTWIIISDQTEIATNHQLFYERNKIDFRKILAFNLPYQFLQHEQIVSVKYSPFLHDGLRAAMGEMNRDCRPDIKLRSGSEDDPGTSVLSGLGSSFDLDCQDKKSGKVGIFFNISWRCRPKTPGKVWKSGEK